MNRRLLLLVLALGLFIRLIFLGQIPSGFTPDEASQGYAAYSLLKTGKDEWGIPYPVTSFRAFADYRAPLQTYLIVTSVAVFGLNEFAVRLPSAIFGTLSILAIYLLTNFLYPKKVKLAGFLEIESGLLAASFMAISPWSIQFSRTALEANFASFLFPFGLYLLLKGIKDSPKLLALSAFILGLDLYSYLAAKLFVPVFLLALLIIYRKTILKKGISYFIPFLIIFNVMAVPIYYDAAFGPGNSRGKDLIITNLSQENLKTISDQQYLSPLNNFSPILTRLFTNKLTFIAQEFSTNYVSYLSPSFWFTEGGRETTYAIFPGNGLIYLWMFPLILIAVFKLLSDKKELSLILILWLLLGIVPAAITKEGYRPNRAGSLMGLWEMVAAIGFIELTVLLPFFKKISGILIFKLIIVISLLFYLNLYFFTSSVLYPDALNYGYRDLINKVGQQQSKYSRVIFDKGSESQVFLAFYTKMDPAVYQQISPRWWSEIKDKDLLFLDMIPHYQLGKYYFKNFDQSTDLKPGNLVIIPANKYRQDMEKDVVDQVAYPNKETAFYLLSVKELVQR